MFNIVFIMFILLFTETLSARWMICINILVPVRRWMFNYGVVITEIFSAAVRGAVC